MAGAVSWSGSRQRGGAVSLGCVCVSGGCLGVGAGGRAA